MDLQSRIERRQRTGGESQLIIDYDAISPIVHLEEPVGRGPILERLLDYLDPIFDGDDPPNAYVSGPSGAGKSAVIAALFTQLETLHSPSQSMIHTATRVSTTHTPSFVYLDARAARSDFAKYHRILDGMVDETIPRQGIGTDTLRSRLVETLDRPGRQVVVAVDHVGEPETASIAELRSLFGSIHESLVWLAIGRDDPATIAAELPPERIEIPAYDTHAVVDIVTERASRGLARLSIEHEETRQLAAWADGDAHNALAALLGAAHRAADKGRSRIHFEDLSAGMNDVPRPSVSIARLFALPANRTAVLRALVDVADGDDRSVDAVARRIIDAVRVDLSEATVKRFLYELAEDGILDREPTRDASAGLGRPPSRIEPRFPTTAFRILFDLRNGN